MAAPFAAGQACVHLLGVQGKKIAFYLLYLFFIFRTLFVH